MKECLAKIDQQAAMRQILDEVNHIIGGKQLYDDLFKNSVKVEVDGRAPRGEGVLFDDFRRMAYYEVDKAITD